jgi:hypothetical protein
MSNAITFTEAIKHLTEAFEEIRCLPGAALLDDPDLLDAEAAVHAAKTALRRLAVAHPEHDLVGPATHAAYATYLETLAAEGATI